MNKINYPIIARRPNPLAGPVQEAIVVGQQSTTTVAQRTCHQVVQNRSTGSLLSSIISLGVASVVYKLQRHRDRAYTRRQWSALSKLRALEDERIQELRSTQRRHQRATYLRKANAVGRDHIYVRGNGAQITINNY